MRTKLLTALLIGSTLAFAQAALAQPAADGGQPAHGQMQETPSAQDAKRSELRAKWDSMSPAEKERFKAERKAKWDALSKEEKVRMIEERRAMKRREMDERWSAMSDDEKIAHTEERMRRNHDGPPCLPDGRGKDAPSPAE